MVAYFQMKPFMNKFAGKCGTQSSAFGAWHGGMWANIYLEFGWGSTETIHGGTGHSQLLWQHLVVHVGNGNR